MATIRFIIKGTNGETFAKRMLKLAWDKSGVRGFGAFRDRGQQTEDAVWANAKSRGDYPASRPIEDGKVGADYVFGRMMKLSYRYGTDFVEGCDGKYTPDYESFCLAYPDFESLAKAAAESLKVEIVNSNALAA